jgi:hypothetical protein
MVRSAVLFIILQARIGFLKRRLMTFRHMPENHVRLFHQLEPLLAILVELHMHGFEDVVL